MLSGLEGLRTVVVRGVPFSLLILIQLSLLLFVWAWSTVSLLTWGWQEVFSNFPKLGERETSRRAHDLELKGDLGWGRRMSNASLGLHLDKLGRPSEWMTFTHSKIIGLSFFDAFSRVQCDQWRLLLMGSQTHL